MKIDTKVRDGIDLWLDQIQQQVHKMYYTEEPWTPKKVAEFARQCAEHGFMIGYEAAKVEEKDTK